jgi:hypothetical protein
MFSFYPNNDRYSHTSYDPFHAWKYEQEMRRRQQAIEEQRLEHEAFLRQRRRQQEEAFRRNQAKQNALRQLQQKQQQGYQVVQDWDGQLYLVPPCHSNIDRVDTVEHETDSDDDCSNFMVEDDQKTIPTRSRNQSTKYHMSKKNGSMRETENSNMQRENASKTQKRMVSTVVIEDVSDSEDADDISATLDKTLRNRRPSPGQWIEPVEIIS